MEKEKFFIVYLEDSKTGKRFADSRFTWVFTDKVKADDFANSLAYLVIADYTVCVAESSSNDCTIYNE